MDKKELISSNSLIGQLNNIRTIICEIAWPYRTDKTMSKEDFVKNLFKNKKL